MTREEYVDFANALKNNYTIDFDKLPEFCDMAISAVSENKGDLISRRAVLDGIAEWIVSGYADSEADCSHISSLVTHLPSVENKGDLISRQVVLDLLQMKYSGKELYKAIYELPSAENKGEWIESKERSGHWYCSVCGGIHTDPETGKWREIFDYKYPFCPNCGCQMNKENNNVSE